MVWFCTAKLTLGIVLKQWHHDMSLHRNIYVEVICSNVIFLLTNFYEIPSWQNLNTEMQQWTILQVLKLCQTESNTQLRQQFKSLGILFLRLFFNPCNHVFKCKYASLAQLNHNSISAKNVLWSSIEFSLITYE